MVVRDDRKVINRIRRVDVRCACGTEKRVSLYSLRTGGSVSCGCVWREWAEDWPARFRQYLSAPDSKGCIVWTGQRNEKGYGVGSKRNTQVLAHRIAYELANGSEPGEMQVCHHCDNPPCCNPEHLFLGTAKDNAADMCAKGRQSRKPSVFGESHHKAKLTIEDVLAIRSSSDGCRKLAAKYGVSSTHITRIRSGKCWPPHSMGERA